MKNDKGVYDLVVYFRSLNSNCQVKLVCEMQTPIFNARRTQNCSSKPIISITFWPTLVLGLWQMGFPHFSALPWYPQHYGLIIVDAHSAAQVEVALEITSDQTVPGKWDLWSDRPRPKWPLIRRVCARRSLCARSALEAASDQTSSRPKWPLIRQVPDHCPD